VSNIGITGTRFGLAVPQSKGLFEVLRRLFVPDSVLHHGDCKGVDEQGAALARSMGYELCSHPPSDDKLRAFVPSRFLMWPLPYMERNRAIVLQSSVLVACPDSQVETLRSGTWSTVRIARELVLPVVLVFPDGRASLEVGNLQAEVPVC
jgi:hypothetical protein